MIKKIGLLVITVCLLSACHNKNKDKNLYNLTEKTLPCSVSCADERNDSCSLLSNDLITQLIPLLKKSEGHQPLISASFPEGWVAEYRLENLSSDFDIWIISNQDDITHKALLTVKENENGYQIIDAILVAFSAANELKDSLESEEWSCNIDKDYTINVQKKYEKILSSLTDTLIPDNKLITYNDLYHISLDGIISYEEPTTYDTDYMAIIQFADTSEMGVELDEDWIWNRIHMQEEIEDYSIFFIEATNHFDNISILNYQGDEVDKINITNFLTKYSKGYIFLKKGSKPHYQRYCPAEECLKNAFPYFGIDTTEREL